MQLLTGMQPRLFELTEAQQLVRDTARNYAQKTLAPIAGQLDRERRFPAEQLAGLAELGMMGVNIAEEYGGAQAGAVAYALAMMEIAQGCASTAAGTRPRLGCEHPAPSRSRSRTCACPRARCSVRRAADFPSRSLLSTRGG